MRKQKRGFGTTLREQPSLEQVAGNGLLHRRALLSGSVAFAGALTASSGLTGAAAEPLDEPEWSLAPGDVTPALQKPRISKTKWCAP